MSTPLDSSSGTQWTKPLMVSMGNPWWSGRQPSALNLHQAHSVLMACLLLAVEESNLREGKCPHPTARKQQSQGGDPRPCPPSLSHCPGWQRSPLISLGLAHFVSGLRVVLRVGWLLLPLTAFVCVFSGHSGGGVELFWLPQLCHAPA